ncbi:MAG: Lsr2 family protein [Cellulomonadaceae bacterium]|jgi:hypothetical protein|nr:Lsr2 family protein [Cellulomonadaceae bacterium]
MVKKLVLHDDIDGAEGAKTVHFMLDGKHYEIDLHEVHHQQLRDALGRFTSKARPAATTTHKVGRPAKGHTTRRPAVSVDRERLAAIRDWARGKGYAVNDRGRIPTKIIAEYDAHHH